MHLLISELRAAENRRFLQTKALKSSNHSHLLLIVLLHACIPLYYGEAYRRIPDLEEIWPEPPESSRSRRRRGANER